MTKTAERVMALFQKHNKVQPGTVLTSSEVSSGSQDWGPSDFAGLDVAFRELTNEGLVIITPSKGLELTEKGLAFLLNES